MHLTGLAPDQTGATSSLSRFANKETWLGFLFPLRGSGSGIEVLVERVHRWRKAGNLLCYERKCLEEILLKVIFHNRRDDGENQ